MLTFELLERTAEYVKYIFVPEGYLRSGVVVFYADGTKDVLVDSEDDIKRLYAGHALNGILKLNRDKGTVAWC